MQTWKYLYFFLIKKHKTEANSMVDENWKNKQVQSTKVEELLTEIDKRKANKMT